MVLCCHDRRKGYIYSFNNWVWSGYELKYLSLISISLFVLSYFFRGSLNAATSCSSPHPAWCTGRNCSGSIPFGTLKMPIKLVTHYIVVRFVFFSKFNFQLLIANAIKKLIQAFRVNCSFRQLVGQRVIEILHLSKLLAHRLHQPECYNRSGISSESGALGDRARVAVGHYTTPPSTIL